MRMCQGHWDELKTKLADRGLKRFISKDSAEAVTRLTGSDPTKTEAENFDPLMAAHNAIVSNGLNAVGLALMMPNDDGTDRCPICFLTKNCPCGQDDCVFKTWLDRSVEDVVEHAGKLGLLEVNQ